MSRTIILVIIGSYLPGEKAGGPVRTTSNMVEWLGDEFEFRILTSDRDIGEKSPYDGIAYGKWQSVGKAKVRYLSPDEQSLINLRNILNGNDCDLLYVDALYSTLTLKTLVLRRLSLLQPKPIVLVPRGQWRPEAMQIKARKKSIFMFGADLIGLYHGLAWHVSSVDELEDVQARVGGRMIDIRAIPNLPLRLSSSRNLLQSEQKSIGSLKMVFLSRIVRNKGLHFILKLLPSISGNIELDIYGSIQDEIYWEECNALIAALPPHATVNYRGVAQFDAVVETLSQYHLFVLPTLSENFGHVILEALMSGCPVLISDRTPWQDLSGAGWVLRLEDTSAWETALAEIVNMDHEHFAKISITASQFGENYRKASQLADELKAFFVKCIENSVNSNHKPTVKEN